MVTGENIEVAGARINASGKAGGGKVLIGGDWGGGKPASGLVQNAQRQARKFHDPDRDHRERRRGDEDHGVGAGLGGDGGKVILWSDSMTTFAGVIEARGGAQAGNGGFVEVSSHDVLNYAGTVDTRAPYGTTGTLLLDPADYYIVTTAAARPRARARSRTRRCRASSRPAMS